MVNEPLNGFCTVPGLYCKSHFRTAIIFCCGKYAVKVKKAMAERTVGIAFSVIVMNVKMADVRAENFNPLFYGDCAAETGKAGAQPRFHQTGSGYAAKRHMLFHTVRERKAVQQANGFFIPHDFTE